MWFHLYEVFSVDKFIQTESRLVVTRDWGGDGNEEWLLMVMGFLFLAHCMACRILVPRPGIEPGPSAVKVPSLNHWTAREFPVSFFLNVSKGYIMFSWLFVVWSHQWSFCKSPVFVCLFVFAFSSREGSRWAWVSVLRKLGGRHLALNVRGVLLGITFL